MIILNALCSFGLFVYSGSTNSLGNINIYSKTGSLVYAVLISTASVVFELSWNNWYYHALIGQKPIIYGCDVKKGQFAVEEVLKFVSVLDWLLNSYTTLFFFLSTYFLSCIFKIIVCLIL